MRYVHLKTFPYTYEINKSGHVRRFTDPGYINFKRVHEPNGTYVYIDVNNKSVKCLLAELILLNFNNGYRLGYEIKYKDGNSRNVIINNLEFKPMRIGDELVESKPDQKLIIWKCKSRADSANNRMAHKLQLISADDVLKALEVCFFRCFYCNDSLNPNEWHLDHFLPISKDGRNHFNNLRASCPFCNRIKSDLNYEQLIVRIDKILTVFKGHHPDHQIFTKLP